MVWSFISTGIYLLKGDMFVKQFIHVQKKIVKEVINIIYFNTINKIPVFFRIIQYKLSFIEIWLTSFIDIGSGWKSVWKKWLYDEKLGRWLGIVDVKFPQIASFFIWLEKVWSGQLLYNHAHNILNILMFYQFFLSPQVKRSLIISNKLVCTSCLTSCQTI